MDIRFWKFSFIFFILWKNPQVNIKKLMKFHSYQHISETSFSIMNIKKLGHIYPFVGSIIVNPTWRKYKE